MSKIQYSKRNFSRQWKGLVSRFPNSSFTPSPKSAKIKKTSYQTRKQERFTLKKILFIATGGTIASKKTENGLTPQITPEELLSYIPEVEGLCEITAVNPFNLDSSNVVPENWSTLVKVVKEHYEDYDGFVIAHGTDTMAYTAAALSYMI